MSDKYFNCVKKIILLLMLWSAFSCRKDETKPVESSPIDSLSSPVDSLSSPIDSLGNSDFWTQRVINLPSRAAGKNLFSISKQGNILYIAGDGIILKSDNQGNTWDLIFENQNMFFFDVKFSDSKIGYAVGWPKGADPLNKIATLYKSVDGGNNWFLLYSSTRRSQASTKFNEGAMRNGAIDFLDESRLIWGCGTTQFYSVTGGRGNYCTLSPIQTYSACFPNINKAFIGSSGLLESLRGGVEFGTSGYSSSNYYDFDLVTTDDLFAIAGGSYNELYKIKVNQTNTSTYKEINGASATDRFYGLDFLDKNFGVIVGAYGKIGFTNDGGLKWSFINPVSSEQFNDVLFFNNRQGIVIGNNGTVVKFGAPNAVNNFVDNVKQSHDESSLTWSKINTGVTADLYDIEHRNGSIFVVGDGAILKSVNNGVTFTTIYSNPSIFFRDISFVNQNIGWVIGYNSATNRVEVYKTSNGGINWILQTTLAGSSPGNIVGMVIEALNNNYILASFASGVNSVKKKSMDGGNTWSNVLGNYGIAPIADFIFFGSNYSSTGRQGYGPKLAGGGSYFASDLDIDEGMDNAGCISLTCPNSVKTFGMNSISTSQGHLAIARDKDYDAISNTTVGYIERSKVSNPIRASDWGCYVTYTDVHYYGVKMISHTEIWLAGEYGTIITTKNRNGGIISFSSAPEPQKEWHGQNTGTHEHLYDIEAIGSNIIIAVGKNGTIIRSN